MNIFKWAISGLYGSVDLDLSEGHNLLEISNFVDALRFFENAISQNSSDSRALIGKGRALIGLNRLDRAIEAFDQAIALGSNHKEAFIGKGKALAGLRRFEDAVDAFERAIALESKCEEAFICKGNALLELEKFHDASEAFGSAIALESRDPAAFVGKGKALLEFNACEEEAVEAFDKAIALQPNSEDAFIQKGKALADLEMFNEAVKSFNKAIELGTTNPEAFLGKAEALEELDEFEDAICQYDKLIELGSVDKEVFVAKGRALINLENYEDAISVLDEAIALDASNEDAYICKGQALAGFGRHEEAIVLFDHVMIDLESTDENAIIGKGQALIELKRFEDAIGVFDQAIELETTDKDAFVGKGEALLGLKRFEEAISAFNQAIALDSEADDIFIGKGKALAGLGRFEEAITAFEEAIAPGEDDAEALICKGQALIALKRFDEAYDPFADALELEPPEERAYIGKAMALRMNSRLEGAVAACDNCLSTNSESLDALYVKGSVLLELRRHQEASQCFQEASTILSRQLEREVDDDDEETGATESKSVQEVTDRSEDMLQFINSSPCEKILQLSQKISQCRNFSVVSHPFDNNDTDGKSSESSRVPDLDIDKKDIDSAVSDVVSRMLDGSWKDWERGDILLQEDVKTILLHFVVRSYSEQNLCSSIFSLVWLLINVARAHPRNGSQLWKTFIHSLENFCIDYIGACDVEAYKSMKTMVNSCLSEFKPLTPQIKQEVPEGEGNPSSFLRQQALNKLESFENKLRRINQDARCNVKGEARIKEKAELDENHGGYDGDFTRVLDYLRGTIYISIDPSTHDLKESVDGVLKRLQHDIGPIRRMKLFKAEDRVPLPRLLLNLDFEGLVCEVQIRFRLWGMDTVYQDFVHELYELMRKPSQDVNLQSHLITMILDMLGKLQINISNDMVKTWIRNCTKVRFSQLEDVNAEDEERVRLIVIEANKGRKKLEIRVKTAIVQENGFFVRVPSYLEKAGEFLMHVKKVSTITE
eukprot:TRINITY_DN5884_c0_g1_i1.p1 TRINITY_DN5884_c0_g1~~TRINITY_DN5884_c0_g1_i1.p1  ORF type:complete len:1002 (+),score=303.46 TRINITY_DN5884_c0_g1_i1:61-3066(+)